MAWAPLLAVFSVTLEASEEPRVVALALRGLRNCIRVAAVLGCEAERSSCVKVRLWVAGVLLLPSW